MLTLAASEGDLIRIGYVDVDDNISTRILEPVEVDEIHLLAYCWLRRCLRRFSIGSIADARIISVEDLLPILRADVGA